MCPLSLEGFEPATVLFEAVPEVQLFLSEAVQLFLSEAVPEVQLFPSVRGVLFPSLIRPVTSGRAP